MTHEILAKCASSLHNRAFTGAGGNVRAMRETEFHVKGRGIEGGSGRAPDRTSFATSSPHGEPPGETHSEEARR